MPKQIPGKNTGYKFSQMSDSELLNIVTDRENTNSFDASGELLFRLLKRVRELEKEVLVLSGQSDKKSAETKNLLL